MCIVTINRCGGRFGNKIMQLVIAAHYAFMFNKAKLLKYDPAYLRRNRHLRFLLKTSFENKEESACQCNNELVWKCKKTKTNNHFFYHQGSHIPEPILSELKYVFQKYIKSNIKPIYFTNNFTKNVIHIRGGDVAGRIGGKYGRKPSEYYDLLVNIFEHNVTIVYESIHPSITYLKNKYKGFPDVIFQSTTFEKDFATLVCCENLGLSVGTFGISSYFFSNTIKKIYAHDFRYILCERKTEPKYYGDLTEFIDIKNVTKK